MITLTTLIMMLAGVVLTLLAFLVGYKFAEFKNEMEKSSMSPCPQAQGRAADPQIQYTLVHKSADTGSVSTDIPKCDPAKDGPRVFDHCVASPYTDRTYLHHFGGNVPDDVFPWLHHPALAAKEALIIKESAHWDLSASSDYKQTLANNCDRLYMTSTGSRSNQPNKCVAVVRVPEGVASPYQHSHRYGFTALLTDQYLNDYARSNCFQEELVLAHPFIQELPRLKQQFQSKMGSPFESDGVTRKTAIIMVANEGVVDLLLNFLCSAEQAKIDLNTIMVFVGSQSDADLVEAMGVHAMYGEALGSMPVHAAKGYLDNTFARMMWYKTTSVYLAVTCGFDVLFQDVDLVWMQVKHSVGTYLMNLSNLDMFRCRTRFHI
jgi:hypothetical protein